MSTRRIPSRSTSLRALTPRHWASRITLISIITFGLLIMTLSRTNQGFTNSVRTTMTDVLVPVMSVVAKPVEAVRDVRIWFSEITSLRSENVMLQAKVSQMAQWQTIANELKAENDALRALIEVVPKGKTTYIASRIVSESGGPFVRAALISGGMENGINADQAVIGTEGLVGRIIEAGNSSARVLLITDINSRVPVISEYSRERSIVSGNNSPVLSLDYVESGSELEVGERLLTSGDGGIFPPGIPVGEVVAVEGSQVTVRPLTDWTRMEYVSAVSYQF
jgi:rod shape-determining protein MreC